MSDQAIIIGRPEYIRETLDAAKEKLRLWPFPH